MNSLWGSAFEPKENKSKTKSTIKKTKSPKKVDVVKTIHSKNISLPEKLNLINSEVLRVLGRFKENTVCIYGKQELSEYIDKAIENGITALDTETNNSLDPITCKLMGTCIYTPGMKNAYVPINHVDYKTGKRLENQCTEADIKEQLDRLKDTKTIFHNAKFDYEVLKCTCNCVLSIYWDTMIGAKILNENEKSAGLKQQYIDKIDSSIEKYSIDKLFEGVEYATVDPEIFALYSATDPYMTYKLFEYQKEQFSLPENTRLYSLFREIEMPVVQVTAEMELTGVCIDKEFAKRLSDKYHKKLDDIDIKINEELSKYDTKISNWRLTPEANKKTITRNGNEGKSKNEQLSDPINISSPTQLAILIYDILKIKPVNKKSPRGTGEDILKQLNLPLCDLILEKRGLLKLINTYIDKLPECVSEKDNRLHAQFNQLGAQTGRFSSSNPNLQNIPSKNNEIRMMFTADKNCTLVGGDFSQQEPRILAQFSNDEHMINSYKDGKDLYAMIASKVYHNNYEDNLEFNPVTGKMQPDGKHRRTSVKSLLLGLMYGRGTNSIAEQLNCSFSEAEKIKNDFFTEFPKVEKWITETGENAHITGYVEDVWGRRRRLPDILKEKYEISSKNPLQTFNPLLQSKGTYNCDYINNINEIKHKLSQCKFRKDVEEVKKFAESKNIKIKDNNGFIAQAERQCVNARIQGSAASMSKKAMIKVFNDERLKELGFKLLIAVHDELIGECPEENKEKVKEYLSEDMITCALPEVTVPMKCDVDDFPSWYFDVYSSEIKKEYDSNEKNFDKLCENHIEMTPEKLKEIIN